MQIPGDDAIWVGKYKDSETFVVYDPEKQKAQTPDYVFLFDVAERKFRVFKRDTARMKIIKVNSSEAIEGITKMYKLWKDRARNQPKKMPLRRTHCWRCKVNLSSRLEKICEECGWMICNECGACGCQHVWD
jgi:hypothetical protein